MLSDPASISVNITFKKSNHLSVYHIESGVLHVGCLERPFLSFDLGFVYKCRVVWWCAWVVGILLHGNRIVMVLIKSIHIAVIFAVHILYGIKLTLCYVFKLRYWFWCFSDVKNPMKRWNQKFHWIQYYSS